MLSLRELKIILIFWFKKIFSIKRNFKAEKKYLPKFTEPRSRNLGNRFYFHRSPRSDKLPFPYSPNPQGMKIAGELASLLTNLSKVLLSPLFTELENCALSWQLDNPYYRDFGTCHWLDFWICPNHQWCHQQPFSNRCSSYQVCHQYPIK